MGRVKRMAAIVADNAKKTIQGDIVFRQLQVQPFLYVASQGHHLGAKFLPPKTFGHTNSKLFQEKFVFNYCVFNSW